MTPADNPTAQAAADYVAAGFAVCQLRPGEKRPTAKGWTTRSAKPSDFRPGDGVGLLCGPLSSGHRAGHALVCVDIDAAELTGEADVILPATDMIDGRSGKPRSHRWYLVDLATVPESARASGSEAAKAAATATGHHGPRKLQFIGPDDELLVELLGTGQQAAVPPSRHTSGEVREWVGGRRGDPALVMWPELVAAVEALAAAGGWVRSAERDMTYMAYDPPPRPPKESADDRLLRRARAYLVRMPGAVSGQRGQAATFRAARVIRWGFGLSEAEALDLLLTDFNPRCEPPWTEAELRHKVADAGAKSFGKPWGWLRDAEALAAEGNRCYVRTSDKPPAGETDPTPRSAPPGWPGPMAQAAFRGVAGAFVRAVEPTSESDPVALLVQFLLGFGNAAGRTVYAAVEADRHYLNEFAVFVGQSSKARRGRRGGGSGRC